MAAVANCDARWSRRDTYVGALTRKEKGSLEHRKELPQIRQENAHLQGERGMGKLRALGVAPAFLEGERLLWLTAALFAKLGSRARDTVPCMVLTASTPH